MTHVTRRDFLARSLLAAGAACGSSAWPAWSLAGNAAPRGKLPVAGVVTVYHNNSHADVILGKILQGWRQDGGPGPDLELVSLYVDQFPEGDLSRGLAEKHGFRITSTIDEALTLGTDKLAVAGVLCIGEHGDYPAIPETGQVPYPRRRFFDEVAATYRRCGQVVPTFNDKHLAYAWADAKHMADTARELQIPFLAGSSLPVAWRKPALALPQDCELDEALAIGYGGPEAYGFHTIEGLQCMVERRRGGETGVRAVEVVKGPAIWEAEKSGRWSRKLFEAALATAPAYREGRPEDLFADSAAFYLIEYRDGLRATVAMANGLTDQFTFAAAVRGQEAPAATWFRLEEDKPFGHFEHLLRAIEHTIHTGQPAYPVERTLLSTGILDTAMHALAAEANRHRIETPELDIAYQPVDWPFAAGDVPGKS
jgi:hypothetical protein